MPVQGWQSGVGLHGSNTGNDNLIVDLRINEPLQTGAVCNRTYRGAKVSIYF